MDAPFTASVPPPRDLLTGPMLDSLRRTKPWVRLLSVLGFIAAGLILIIGIFMVGFGLIGGSATKSAGGGIVVAGLGVLYSLLALLYFFPALYLSRYASAIGRAITTGPRVASVEDALRQQKSFWKFTGIAALIMILLYIPGVLAAIAIPNFLTAIQRSKQKRTAADMRTVATAVEAYAVDKRAYPDVASESALATLLEPTYVRTLPRVDGWGNPIRYAAVCENGVCDGYVIASAGKDGTFEHQQLLEYLNDESGEVAGYDNDLVYSNGSFVHWAKGTR
ncbi:MAG: type II secretion system protein GspG [Thermoanaerobaculia bacterium]